MDTAGGEADFWAYERIPRLVLESGEIDAVLLTGYFGGYGQDDELAASELEVAQAIPRAAAETGRPLVVQTMYASSPAATALREGGVPVYREIEAAAGVLARLAGQAAAPAHGVPELPRPVPEPVDGLPAGGGYFEARRLLAAAGVPFAEARQVGGVEEARVAAAAIGYPVVLKALGLLHKSDAGGVVLGIEDEAALERSVSDLATRLSPEGYSVERMAPLAGGVELIAGCRQDARFGPVVLVGVGGVFAEILRDVAVALAPVDTTGAAELLRSLRGAPLLLGARGRPAVDLAAAAQAVAALSRVAAAHPEIAEIEVNPLLARPDGVLGLDARLVLASHPAPNRVAPSGGSHHEGEDDAR